MKYFVVLLLVLLCGLSPPCSAQIAGAEYFIDSDPGAGSGVPLAAAGESVNLDVPIAPGNLTSGFHRLGLRFRDSTGVWSPIWVKTFFVAEPISGGLVDGAEYRIDNDPPIAANFSPVEHAGFETRAGTLGLALGFHRLALRFRDSTGVWSLTREREFYVSETASGGLVSGAEYFIDNGAPIGAAFPPTEQANFSAHSGTNGLGPGFHRLSLRFRNEQGNWSLSKERSFYLQEAATAGGTITAFDYAIDAGNRTAIPLTLTDQAQISEDIPGAGLPPGFHDFNLRFQGENGQWSAARDRKFFAAPPVLGSGNIVEAQATIHGRTEFQTNFDTTFALQAADGALDSTREDLVATLLTDYVLRDGKLPRGDYLLSVLCRDDLNEWSNTLSARFLVSTGLIILPCLPTSADVTLRWLRSPLDVGAYAVYRGDSADGIYNFVDSTAAEIFVHEGVLAAGMKGYYRVTADYLGAQILVRGKELTPMGLPRSTMRIRSDIKN